MSTEQTTSLLGEVRAEMARQGVTVSKIASTTDIGSQSTTSRKIAGKTPMTIGDFLDICDALAISPTVLTARAEAHAQDVA